MSHDFDLLVIGGGSGGVRCARIAGGHGARVAIVEASHWGGTCVNVGCVPKKLMAQAAEYGDLAQDSRGFGWDHHRGTHDWAALIAAKDGEIARLNGAYVSMLEKAGVTVIEGHARFEDAHTVLVESGRLAPDAAPRRITAARIVIATGGRPTRPPGVAGAELGIVSDDAFHLAARPQRVVMVGGGYIGVEFASIFRGLGSDVTLVYRQNLPLRGFDEDLRQGLDRAFVSRGIATRPGRSPTRIERAGNGFVVTLDDDSTLDTDLVFFATGRTPLTDGLGLERAGVVTTNTGRILVDATQATAQPHIFAIGDVTNALNLTPVAIAEGHRLADRLFGSAPPRDWSFDTTPKAVFFSPPLASVGLTEAEAAARGPADIYLTRFTPMRHHLSGAKRETLMKLVVEQSSQVVVGAHMIGDEAPEMMQGLAIAVTAGLTKQDFDRTIGIHPTSAEEFVTLRSITRSVGQATT